MTYNNKAWENKAMSNLRKRYDRQCEKPMSTRAENRMWAKIIKKFK